MKWTDQERSLSLCFLFFGTCLSSPSSSKPLVLLAYKQLVTYLVSVPQRRTSLFPGPPNFGTLYSPSLTTSHFSLAGLIKWLLHECYHFPHYSMPSEHGVYPFTVFHIMCSKKLFGNVIASQKAAFLFDNSACLS